MPTRSPLRRWLERSEHDRDNLVTYAFDLSDDEAVDGVVDEVEKRLKNVDVLVNITGGPPPTLASETSDQAWMEHFQKIVLPVVRLTNLVLPGMRRQGWGRIITSTSSGVVAPITNMALSNGLRSSLVGWSKTLAGEVAADGVTVNVVVPGRIATPRVDQLDHARASRENREVHDVRRQSMASIPIGRYGTPEEFGAAVAFLSSCSASYITGSMMRIDGGLLTNV